MAKHSQRPKFSARREKIHEIIFEADTPEGKMFDIFLLVFIILSVLTVMLETVERYEKYADIFHVAEWIFTIVFTIEYGLRMFCVYSPKKYATSFYGVIDLLSILPTYISIFVPGSQSLLVIRALRLLRVFRIFKLANFLIEGHILKQALKNSRAKITLFLTFVMIVVCIFGSAMYLIEGLGGNQEFDSIPRSIYWAIVTLTTVGYGDIHPVTPLGQFLSSIVMIMGYAIIAVPTGIVTSEMTKTTTNSPSTQSCKFCTKEGHDDNAIYCKFCGEELNPPIEDDLD